MTTSQRLPTIVYRDGAAAEGARAVPEETALSLVFDGGSHAVMMGTPADLEDFAVGFSFSEGLIGSIDDIVDCETVEHEAGIELRIWLVGDRAKALATRRRHLAGPTGCGLCGIDSLEEAVRTPRIVKPGRPVTPADIADAIASMAPGQELNRETRAVHAAGFWTRSEGLVMLREDVGRHNALDKLVGGMLRGGVDAADGILVLSSRVSIEMVQKAASLGAPVLAAVSAPTALAVRAAETAGMTLVGIVRTDGFEIFTRPDRIRLEGLSHVA